MSTVVEDYRDTRCKPVSKSVELVHATSEKLTHTQPPHFSRGHQFMIQQQSTPYHFAQFAVLNNGNVPVEFIS